MALWYSVSVVHAQCGLLTDNLKNINIWHAIAMKIGYHEIVFLETGAMFLIELLLTIYIYINLT